MTRHPLFMDLEFTGLHLGTTMISIALVSLDGRTFYAERSDYDRAQVTPWIEERVISKLQLQDKPERWVNRTATATRAKGCKLTVAQALKEWLLEFGPIEIWCDVGTYDWPLFCDLFEDALKLPKHVPNLLYFPLDLATFLRDMGEDPDASRIALAAGAGVEGQHHNALYDAYVIRAVWVMLMAWQRKEIPGTRLARMREMLLVQGDNGNWNYSPAMLGMYNGMEFMMAMLEDREPQFRGRPEQFLEDVQYEIGDPEPALAEQEE